jgi:hypothetical protein
VRPDNLLQPTIVIPEAAKRLSGIYFNGLAGASTPRLALLMM